MEAGPFKVECHDQIIALIEFGWIKETPPVCRITKYVEDPGAAASAGQPRADSIMFDP
jgi:hypothetical protein